MRKKSEATPTPAPAPADLEAQLAADRQRRTKEFAAVMEAAIKTHRVQIVPVIETKIGPDGVMRYRVDLTLVAQ